MKGLISYPLGFFQRSSNHRTAATRNRRVRPRFEDLEGRQLMTAAPVSAPAGLLIYYGYLSEINNAQSLSQAASAFGHYADVVLGDGIEAASHPDHSNTVAILSNPALAHTTVFGYVDLGVSTENLSISQMENEINEWKSTGVKGIFLDDFGYDFGATRARQNTIVQYAHSQGLSVTANAFVPADAFGSQVNPTYNPKGTPTALNANDFYLYEDYQVSEGSYVSASDWQAKARSLATYQSAIGFKVMATTTNNAADAFNQNEYNYAWYSALQAGYAAVSWGEYNYASDTGLVPTRTAPVVNAGTTFTGNITQSGSSFVRNTNTGQIVVNTTTHTGSFTTTSSNTPTVPTTGPFAAAYGAVPNVATTLGQPTSGVLNGSGGATYIQFQNGQIILPPGSSTAYSIYGAIYKAYAPAWAAMGQPQSSIQSGSGGATYIQFQNGQIILPPGSNTAYVLDGAIYQAYTPAWSALGQPTSGVLNGSGGASFIQFQNGQIILPPGSITAYVIDGAIYAAYAKNSAWVTMGQPVSGQYAYNGGLRINFQHGYIVWTAAAGAKLYNS